MDAKDVSIAFILIIDGKNDSWKDIEDTLHVHAMLLYLKNPDSVNDTIAVNLLQSWLPFASSGGELAKRRGLLKDVFSIISG